MVDIQVGGCRRPSGAPTVTVGLSRCCPVSAANVARQLDRPAARRSHSFRRWGRMSRALLPRRSRRKRRGGPARRSSLMTPAVDLCHPLRSGGPRHGDLHIHPQIELSIFEGHPSLERAAIGTSVVLQPERPTHPELTALSARAESGVCITLDPQYDCDEAGGADGHLRRLPLVDVFLLNEVEACVTGRRRGGARDPRRRYPRCSPSSPWAPTVFAARGSERWRRGALRRLWTRRAPATP